MHYSKVTPEMLLDREKIFSLSQLDPLTRDDVTSDFLSSRKIRIPAWYCFIVNYMLGSPTKASEYIKSTGFLTDRGTSVSKQYVFVSSWEWVIFNPEKSKPFVKDEFYKSGVYNFTDEDFYLYLLKRLVGFTYIANDLKVVEWMVKYNMTSEQCIQETKLKRPHVYKYFTDQNKNT